jgi:hypothetical protein
MSYSFSIRAKTKSEASDTVAAELAQVGVTQPVHVADWEIALTTAEAMVKLLEDPSDTEEIGVSVSGYLSWREEGRFTTANVSVTASLVPKL